MMKKFSFIIAMLALSFFGGSAAQFFPIQAATMASYQLYKGFFGGAAQSLPSWVDSHYGFSGASTVATSQASVFSVSPDGQFGALLASRSSDWITGTYYPDGVTILAVMDRTSSSKNVWGAYTQGEFLATAAAGAELLNHESSIYNQNVVVTTLDPFTPNVGGATVNFRPDCGVGVSAPPPTNNCTSAVQILNNGAAYASPAIIIGSTAQSVANDASAPAIALADYNSIAGYHAAGTIGFKIFGGVGSPSGVVSCAARCLYIREDGGANTTLYINETGGGTSGWAAK